MQWVRQWIHVEFCWNDSKHHEIAILKTGLRFNFQVLTPKVNKALMRSLNASESNRYSLVLDWL